MDLSIQIALVVGAVGLLLFYLYRYSTRTFGYWESLGVPTVEPSPLFGTMRDYFNKPAEDVENERYQKYGKIYGTYEFMVRALNIADPELAHQVLVKDFPIFTNRRKLTTNLPLVNAMLQGTRDETWKRIRTVVSPSFTSGKMRKMNPHFVEASEGLINNFVAAAESQDLIDMKKYFSTFSLDVIGSCGFGIRVDSMKNPDHPFAVNARKIFEQKMSIVSLLLFIFPSLLKILGNWVFEKLGFIYFMEVCDSIIKQRNTGNQKDKRIDMLQLMLDARDGKIDKDDAEETLVEHTFQENENSKKIPAWNVNKTLSDLEIKAQSILFFLAGHETTSTALTFIAYELALNPDIQDKLLQNVQETYEKHGEFNYDIVSKMPYLEAVINETLRLHTVSLRLEREASQDYVLGSTGITIPKGGIAVILVHAIHHDPEWYPEPYRFNPDRFLPENRSNLTPYTFIPFGDGPRNCLAMRFAMLEIKLCLAMILRKIKFVATEETMKPVEFINNAMVLIPKSLHMRVETRT